jgi:hypothetical protein
VKGLPIKLLGSMSSANAKMSAMVLADDMLSSRLLEKSWRTCPSKECIN